MEYPSRQCQVEVGTAGTMIEGPVDRSSLYPERLIADNAYGSTPMLGWLVEERGIEPRIPVSTSWDAARGPSSAPTSPTTVAPL